ncbi:MAG: 4-alpha-glucanotransferase [Ferruginibacter sp.]
MILNFFIRYSTKFGQTLFVSGNDSSLGDDDFARAVPLQYFNEELWRGRVELPATGSNMADIGYRYILKQADETLEVEWGNDRVISLNKIKAREIVLFDTWNYSGEIENAFFTKAFQEVLLKTKLPAARIKPVKIYTHEFKVKAPLLKENEILCLGGSCEELGNWKTGNTVFCTREGNWWTVRINLSSETFPIAYKYGVINAKEKTFLGFEPGRNRTLNSESGKSTLTIINDGFAQVARPDWKGAGVAIPVFSLRTNSGLGTGEFTDIKLLVDWAKLCGLKLIQLLPINDTTATHTSLDSYPYAAISAFALHPLYLNLAKIAGSKNAAIIKTLAKTQSQLNDVPGVEYEKVMKLKFSVAKELYSIQKDAFFSDTKYFEFFELNRHWLVPYAVFCYLRDKYKTADYNQWKSHNIFDEAAIQQLASPRLKHYDSIALHYFIQYHLHLQLKDATDYAHKNGIIVKGDLPIGIYRFGCDAWMAPQLYNMNAQAGAPPDDFAVKGQNWGFPTYNWKKMQEDEFTWWRKRFEQMSEYFDAFRIDHILGFFRIWSIPLHAVEGVMGRFVPAIPVHINELNQQAISFQHHRYCKPYIPGHTVHEMFGDDAAYIKDHFLFWNEGSFQLKPDFDTQRKVAEYFQLQPDTPKNLLIKNSLFDMISNVIFFEEEGSQMQQFHFRINMEQTSSFRDLDDHLKHRLKQLYINYFFQRQDSLWKNEAMYKLPGLKRSTNMLVCGEDLGMVPACVPDVMRQLGLLSLEIQRMPKDPQREFFHPADAPYLSVVTPCTHDMSTIRGWWEEDPGRTQRFYNLMLGHYGVPPLQCTPKLNQEIVIQHLYSSAMWSIFQLQDILGMDGSIRRDDANEERINIPANPQHYWNYRMHLGLEELISQKEFNNELQAYVKASGR